MNPPKAERATGARTRKAKTEDGAPAIPAVETPTEPTPIPPPAIPDDLKPAAAAASEPAPAAVVADPGHDAAHGHAAPGHAAPGHAGHDHSAHAAAGHGDAPAPARRGGELSLAIAIVALVAAVASLLTPFINVREADSKRVQALETAIARLEARLTALDRPPVTAPTTASAVVSGAAASPADRLLPAALLLRQTVETNRPFARELALASQAGAGDAAAKPLLDALARHAEQGVATQARLVDQFRELKVRLLAAERPSWAGAIGPVWRWAGGGRETGNTVAWIEFHLLEGELAEAAQRARQLKGGAMTIALPWVERVEARVAVDQSAAALQQRAVDLAGQPRK
jgi:hypothetical protein